MADIYSESTPSRSRRRWERLRDDEREITGRARMAWLDSRADYARIRTTRVRRRCDMIRTLLMRGLVMIGGRHATRRPNG